MSVTTINTNTRRLIGWCDAKAPRCAKGHVLHGLHVVGNQFFTCQHKAQGKYCARHGYIVAVMDHCIVIDLSRDEFEMARESGKLGDELRADLQALVEAAVWVTLPRAS